MSAVYVANDSRCLSAPVHGFEHRLFECPTCDRMQNEIVASDPMKSASAGWLAAELRAPS